MPRKESFGSPAARKTRDMVIESRSELQQMKLLDVPTPAITMSAIPEGCEAVIRPR
jgi:hypothetical protein